jgi:hypothetical protein
MSAWNVAWLLTKPVSSSITESFSPSWRPVSRRQSSPRSSHAVALGVTGGPLIGMRSTQGLRRYTPSSVQAQRDSPSRQLSSGPRRAGGASKVRSAIRASSSSLAPT